ncbi:MAG: antitoxin [Micrococcales bacterium]|nr:antitoxin [Micrococcales bacterium]
MAVISVRNLSDETHRALKARAAQNQRSTEAEVRAILDAAVGSQQRVWLGSLLTEIGRDAGGVDLAVDRRTHRGPPDFS